MKNSMNTAEDILRNVCIVELPGKGNYYIVPYVSNTLSLPVKIMKISETSDNELFEAAVSMMDYCRKPTLEEIEESKLIRRDYSVFFDAYGFKKITGFTVNMFDKNSYRVSLTLEKGSQYIFRWYKDYKEEKSLASIDSDLSEKAKALREALIQSAVR